MPAGILRNTIRTVPDWPHTGIQFRDITPVLQDADVFRLMVNLFASRYRSMALNYVAGIDARGFIIGAALAYELGLGFIPVRKKGKLPFATVSEDYALEYGTAAVEIHVDACGPGDRVLLIDDLVATGGTLLAAARLIRKLGGEIVEAAAIVDLSELGGSALVRAAGIEIYTACAFAEH